MSSLLPVTKSRIFLKSRDETCSKTLQYESGRSNITSTTAVNNNIDKRLANTFVEFIRQLDELLSSLRTEEHMNSSEYMPEYTSYQDICEKLRLEVLIAIDKLELTTFTVEGYNENNIEFLNKMNNLKYQLSEIRCQYHNAIKDFDFKIGYD